MNAGGAGIHPGQLYAWRRQLRARPSIGFAPVQVAVGSVSAELAGGVMADHDAREANVGGEIICTVF